MSSMLVCLRGHGADGFSVRKVGGASTTEYPRSGPCASVLNNQRPQYELIEPLTGPSIPADWLAERGEGFHHVGYVVASLAHVTAEMEAAGHPAVARIHSFGANGDGAAAYFDTADALGFMVEAVEPPAPMPTTDFTY